MTCASAIALTAAAARRHAPDPELVRLRSAAHWAESKCPVVRRMLTTGPALRPGYSSGSGWQLAGETAAGETLHISICGNAVIATHATAACTTLRSLPLPETLRKATT
mgnify:FL=1|jgi:hypothetical protein